MAWNLNYILYLQINGFLILISLHWRGPIDQLNYGQMEYKFKDFVGFTY